MVVNVMSSNKQIRKALHGLLLVGFVQLAAPATASELQQLDQGTQGLKSSVLDLSKQLAVLEEELLYPANSQLAVFVSMDLGEYFSLDSIELQLDGKNISNYLYTDRETDALYRGGVQKLWLGDLPAGEHELVAIFTGKGPHERDYRRGAALSFDKAAGAKYVELRIADSEQALRPEFVVREWD
jgi:hypothetical protein